MQEIYRDREYSMVVYFRNLLEYHGIPTMLRSENLSTIGITDFPIPEFFPNICVMNDSDYNKAREIIQNAIDSHTSISDLSLIHI